MPKKSSKRFFLVHVFGSVDPSIMGRCHKTFESLQNHAQKFRASDEFTDGEDGLFYLVTQDKKAPRMFSFGDSAFLSSSSKES